MNAHKINSIVLFLMLLAFSEAIAQDKNIPANSTRDSIRYTKLREKLTKSAMGREIYRFLFKDVYQQNMMVDQNQIEQNPYEQHEGKVIRKITIKRLNVFGESVYDTTQKATVWYDKALNKLHKNTLESIIQNSFLLFKEGDVIVPRLLWDNERLLRSTAIFHDARILIIPDAQYPNLVDIQIITQDVWSLEPILDVGGIDRYTLGLSQRNVRGLGQTWNTSFFFNKSQSPRWEFRSNYLIPYIKKTYIRSEANLSYFRDFKQLSIKASRQFLTPDTKWAGSAELSRNQTNNYIFYQNTDSLISFPLNYNFAEAWLGRAFKLKIGSKSFQERSQYVVSSQTNLYKFTR